MPWLHGMIVYKMTCQLYTPSVLPGKYMFYYIFIGTYIVYISYVLHYMLIYIYYYILYISKILLASHRVLHPPMAPGSESSDQKSPTGTRTPRDTTISLLLPQVHIPTKKGEVPKIIHSKERKKSLRKGIYGHVSGKMLIYFELSQRQATDSSKEKQ